MITQQKTKVCRLCGQKKPLSIFVDRNGKKNPRAHYCKECRIKRNQQISLAISNDCLSDNEKNFTISDKEAINLLWEEFKYLHQQYWTGFYRFGSIILAVNVIPYVKPNIIKPLGVNILMFPIVGALLTLIGTWLLHARYQRLAMIKKKYDEILGKKYLPDRMPREKLWQKIATWRMGRVLFISFGIGLLLFSFTNAIILNHSNNQLVKIDVIKKK